MRTARCAARHRATIVRLAVARIMCLCALHCAALRRGDQAPYCAAELLRVTWSGAASWGAGIKARDVRKSAGQGDDRRPLPALCAASVRPRRTGARRRRSVAGHGAANLAAPSRGTSCRGSAAAAMRSSIACGRRCRRQTHGKAAGGQCKPVCGVCALAITVIASCCRCRSRFAPF